MRCVNNGHGESMGTGRHGLDRWRGWLAIPICLLATPGCVSQFRPGDCFVMRGTGSVGTVLEAQQDRYTVQLRSDRARTRWPVPKKQLHHDARPLECTESR
jgi:hypothetical protein